MKTKLMILLINSLIIVSCTNQNSKEIENKNVQDQTPQVLDDKRGDYSISSLSKRYQADIIEDLYQEAMEKDASLKTLNNKIIEMEKIKNTDLKNYYEYIQNNNQYWLSVNSYTSQIKDEKLKKSTDVLFKDLEAKYKKTITKHEIVKSNIDQKTEELNDQLILLKLMSTLEMMKNYQLNKLPKIEVLKEVDNKYNGIIKETKDFIKK